jgi:hypothetical protein
LFPERLLNSGCCIVAFFAIVVTIRLANMQWPAFGPLTSAGNALKRRESYLRQYRFWPEPHRDHLGSSNTLLTEIPVTFCSPSSRYQSSTSTTTSFHILFNNYRIIRRFVVRITDSVVKQQNSVQSYYIFLSRWTDMDRIT